MPIFPNPIHSIEYEGGDDLVKVEFIGFTEEDPENPHAQRWSIYQASIEGLPTLRGRGHSGNEALRSLVHKLREHILSLNGAVSSRGPTGSP